MAPIQLALDEPETSCFGNYLSGLFGKKQPEQLSFKNEKFTYPVSSGMEELPRYEDCIEQIKKLNIECTDEIKQIVNHAIDSISDELRAISLDLHENMETGMKEVHAHNILTGFLEKQGFKVTRHAYGMDTAFTAEYSRGSGRRIGICSEYDGLPGLGQGCGHNLIAISGLASAVGIKAVLESGKASGKVILFGTPAEELSIGKIILVQKRAFQDNVDVCLMLHPAANNHQYAKMIAIHDVRVEFFGKPSHAAAAPWEGVNALDAIVQVWNNVSMLRQQLLPTDRIHGIITDGGQAPNIIPEHTSAFFFVRTMKLSQTKGLMKKLENCFEAAALATGCQVKYTWREIGVTKDVIQNSVMADTYAHHMEQYGIRFPSKEEQISKGGASTDMGNVSYEVPVIHPMYGIHTTASNHTIEFTAAAKTPQAHKDTITASKCLAATGIEVLLNEEYFNRVTIHTFNYEWSLVSAAQWQKYPNDHCPHVQHVDVLNRTVDPESGILTTERLITVKQNVPRLILKLMGAEETQYVREVSTIDPKAKTFTLTSENLSLCNIMKCNEEISYTVSPEDSGKTQFTQQATMSVGSLLSRWENLIEDFSIKRFQQNAQVGREGFLHVLERFMAAKQGSSTAN
ncbi:hypothetical protein G6F48_003094 [Rhizopus delemar]|nr:hypothetical protein G6F48_003094 [Rhizopus delemar]